jgi:membrane-associated protease RseP (regulator of RpoE activity)
MALALTIFVCTALALLIHESGHAAAARVCGMTVKELALGLGPRLCRVRAGGVEFSLRALPLGSFVRLDGAELRSLTLPRQFLVHLGGVLGNALAGALFYDHLFGWVNLLIAAGNLLPLYQHDGWKCGLALVRSLAGRQNRPVEWTFTFSGGFVSLLFVWLILRALA